MKLRSRLSKGFTLVEAVVALGVLVTAIAGLAGLFLRGTELSSRGRRPPVAMAMATQKLEQLRGLAWTFDESGAAISDLTTDTSLDPPSPGAGTGLSASPADTLDIEVPGWVDYADEYGRPLGAGAAAKASAMFGRRWKVTPQEDSPDLLELQVCVHTHPAIHGPRSSAVLCLATARARR
jgi:type II secretory pathway pseudopilin PulG